jgi:hypothetical protein
MMAIVSFILVVPSTAHWQPWGSPNKKKRKNNTVGAGALQEFTWQPTASCHDWLGGQANNTNHHLFNGPLNAV